MVITLPQEMSSSRITTAVSDMESGVQLQVSVQHPRNAPRLAVESAHGDLWHGNLEYLKIRLVDVHHLLSLY
jgi:hypothetical protein